MAKINKEEYEVLKGLNSKWKWIARDEDGGLWVYKSKPNKMEEVWHAGVFMGLNNYILQFIQWKDEEPKNIQELIHDYEYKTGTFDWATAFQSALHGEREETKVKKDKKWLLDKWTKERNETDVYDPMYQFISEFIADVNQLDEPEITLDRAFEKIAESYPMTKEEIQRHLERLAAHGGENTSGETEVKKDKKWLISEIDQRLEAHKETNPYNTGVATGMRSSLFLINQLDEPEVLSQKWKSMSEYEKLDNKWIDDHVVYADVRGGTQAFIHVDKLQNLLVPKQEITEEQAWEVIHGKYGDETLQNNIDYVESQGYVVIEKPTIPQFVADYIEEMEGTSWGNITDLFGQAESTLGDWWQGEANFEKLARAWLDGYMVEEEQKYYVIDKEENILLIRGYEGIEKADNLKIANSGGGALKLTEQEIKDYDPRFWAFAVKVEELEQ